MAKAPPVSYGALSLKPSEQPAEAERAKSIAAEDAPRPKRPVETKADPTLVYMSPEAKLALKHFALARGPKVKVHDLLIEALEEWSGRKGVRDQAGRPVEWRVPSNRVRRSS
ncbi:hypothetical protein ABIE45_006348 [Methylobacterium sp. OAE515]|uniref:hypothetical protein n=1 Tax=Methylobacterium sp. OAE515 TaxID=2817895 RepID=UPI001788F87E